MNKIWSKKNLSSLVLYVCAGLLAIYAVWAVIHCAGIISEAASAGQISASDNLYDIVSFYMANCAQYFVYALLLSAAGLILQMKRTAPSRPAAPVDLPRGSANDDELDEWFQEMAER